VGREGFAPVKARDLDPVVRMAGGQAHVVEGELWGAAWRDAQEEYFRDQGLDLHVAPPALVPQIHGGPVRMRRVDGEMAERVEALREENVVAAHDPQRILKALTRTDATFTLKDLDRFLAQHLARTADAEVVADVRAAVLASPELVTLYDRERAEASDRFTTRAVRQQEQAAMAAARDLADRGGEAITPASVDFATRDRTLRPDQRAAFAHATAPGGLKIIEGRAGTGKSYTLSAIRDAFSHEGMRVLGLAPTHAVVQDMRADGFGDAATVHSELYKLREGLTQWDENMVVMVDEAAMLDARAAGELLAAANQSGAKLILVGDDRQLASVVRGGLFNELILEHGSAEITEVTRQQVEWQRRAAQDLANYRFIDAVAAFERAGAITWRNGQNEARDALIDAWAEDRDANPGESSFVFAYTNSDVDALNTRLRQICRDRGELTGPDILLETQRSKPRTPRPDADQQDAEEEPEDPERGRTRREPFAVGDRIQFTGTDKNLGIYNGNVGSITAIDPQTGEVRATIDATGGAGRDVAWNANEFKTFRHGYAGTIYKGQGKTLDRTYLYHSKHWKSAPSYVALTRQRKSAKIFVARETADNVRDLAWQMGRNNLRLASLAWRTHDEPAVLRVPAQPEAINAPADMEEGRARFREGYAARRLERERADAGTMSERELIDDWDRRVARYRTALPQLDHDAAYAEARDHLMSFATVVLEQPALVATLQERGDAFGVTGRPLLRRLIASAEPAQDLARIIEDSERSLRAQRQALQDREEPRIENRHPPRPRDRDQARE
jgi:ATP-dependent exoDNAse (exonuclease V) alpha subunit